MLRRKEIALALISLTAFSGGLALGQTALTPSAAQTAAAEADKTTGTAPAQSEPGSSAPAADPAKPADVAPAAPPAPLTPEEQKAADNKAALDTLLAEATTLRNSYEASRRTRSKTPVSLSSFRSMELRLQMAAAANPTDTAASDMANAMRMIQYEILQPSVQIAAVANRELYAHQMGQKMRDDGMRVVASGRGNSTVRFISPQMTKQMAMQLVDTAKIPQQARALQFSRVVFSNGRRSWSYNVARGRLR